MCDEQPRMTQAHTYVRRESGQQNATELGSSIQFAGGMCERVVFWCGFLNETMMPSSSMGFRAMRVGSVLGPISKYVLLCAIFWAPRQMQIHSIHWENQIYVD